MFLLKFLLCDQEEEKKEVVRTKAEGSNQQEDAAKGVSKDQQGVKNYAITSYMKLLTQRVHRLEQEISRQKKISVVMVNNEKNEQRDSKPYKVDLVEDSYAAPAQQNVTNLKAVKPDGSPKIERLRHEPTSVEEAGQIA